MIRIGDGSGFENRLTKRFQSIEFLISILFLLLHFTFCAGHRIGASSSFFILFYLLLLLVLILITMSFTIFPRHAKYGNSSWKRQVVLNRSTNHESSLSTPTETQELSTDSSSSDGENDNMSATAQKEELHKRRSLAVKLDPTLFQRLQQDSGQGQPIMESNTDNKKNATTTINNNNQVRKLKSSLRQVVSAPTSPQHGPSKSVKFDPFHLEKVCFFEGSHSPNEVPRYEENKYPPFKVLYSHWPPIQHTIFQQQQNVQLKRSLKVLEGGSVLSGQVLVRNLGYHKEVEIRYTLDGWQTVKNVKAGYLHSRGSLDTFTYEFDIEQGMADRGYVRVTVDMAVRYTVMATVNNKNNNNQSGVEETYWDNNDGHNYQIQVVETSRPQTSSSPSLTTMDSSSSLPTSSISTKRNDLGFDNDLLPTSSLPIKSSTSSASYRYDFGQSLFKAKHNTKPSLSSPLSSAPTSPCSSPPLSSSPSIPPSPISDSITINNINIPSTASSSLSSFDNVKYTSSRKSQSAPSSPESSSLIDFFQSTGNHPLASASYSDLVNKYCFYGSQDTSPALSING
ncbi:putative phosphatase regulatory subunit-domain-containing protein, partial [Chlamydoabsidia padenii]